MKTEDVTSTPNLRQRQKAATSDLILDAVGACLADTGLSQLSIDAVAVAAGIAKRTICRHFETREAMLDAWWARHKRDIGQERFPDTAAALLAFPRRAFPKFDAEAEVMRGMVLSEQGRAMTLSANDKRKLAMRAAVRDGAGDLPEPQATQVAAAVQLLQSATAWLTMREYWGLSGAEAGEAAALAIAALLDHAAGRTAGRIFHASLPAHDPALVAGVLAEIWGGQAMGFDPVPGALVVVAGDAHGSAIEVYPAGTRLLPGAGDTMFDSDRGGDTGAAGVHLALATALEEAAIQALAARHGWRAVRCSRGGLFDVIEFWLENALMVELLTPEMQSAYRAASSPDAWRAAVAS
jgi:AcrR family transcriptional regulator